MNSIAARRPTRSQHPTLTSRLGVATARPAILSLQGKGGRAVPGEALHGTLMKIVVRNIRKRRAPFEITSAPEQIGAATPPPLLKGEEDGSGSSGATGTPM